MKMPDQFFEITTRVGCPVNCIRYCPQEVINREYRGERNLTLAAFKQLTATVPDNITYSFAGVSEPFINPEALDMIEHVSDRGNPIIIFSTLVGLTPDGVERLKHIDIDYFILHLPDAFNHARIPITRNYKDTLAAALTSIKNLECMNMGGLFRSDNNERLFRDQPVEARKGRVTCAALRSPQYSLLPNGTLYFCCVTKGVAEVVGSLYEQTFPDLVACHSDVSRRLQTDPESVCHRCTRARGYYTEKVAALPIFGFRDYLMKEKRFQIA